MQAEGTRKVPGYGEAYRLQVCVYINNRWCNNVKIHDKVFTPDTEMLTLSLHPCYLPREFLTVVISCVYFLPAVNTNTAAGLAAQNVHAMLSKYPDAPVFYMWIISSFKQYVDYHIGKDVLDLCYGSI